MSGSIEGYSYYKITPEPLKTIPKTFHDKKPVRADDSGTVIKTGTTDLPQGGSPPRPEPTIKHKDFDRMAKLGDFKDDDEPFKLNRLTTLNEIDKYYRASNEIPLSVPLPLFDPSDKIHLNTEEGALMQWENYMRKVKRS